MFIVGVSSETASLLTGSMSFVMRQLPVHHLGLSLLLGRLHPTGCASLIQRITSRIRYWAA